MPIGFDPNDTCEVKLDCIDKGKPDDQRAVFVCRYLTSGQRKKMERLYDEANKTAKDAEKDALLNEGIRVGIIGWRNLIGSDGREIPFSDEGLDELTFRQKFRILDEYPARVSMSEGDRKN